MFWLGEVLWGRAFYSRQFTGLSDLLLLFNSRPSVANS